MRKWLPFICIVLLITTAVFGILYFSAFKSGDNTVAEASSQEEITLRSSVYTGTIESTIVSEGKVLGDSPDVYIESVDVELPNKADVKKLEVKHKNGDILKKGDVLYTYGSEVYKVNNKCKIVDIEYEEKSVHFSLLNFDKLYIIAPVDINKLNMLSLDTKATYTIDIDGEDEVYDADIFNFGYEVNDNKVDVFLNTKQELLPGTDIKVTFSFTKETESLYILKQMLMMDGDQYYVFVENEDGTSERRNVEIGEFFEEYNDGEKVEFVEVLDGVKLGEKLIITSGVSSDQSADAIDKTE